MKARITSYMKYIDGLLAAPSQDTDWDTVIAQHLIQLNFFMHERLIHLIVTITFALMECVVLTLVVTQISLSVTLLFLLILVLLIPYVMHYYLLENSVQYMYRQYDAMLKAKGARAFSME